MERCCRGGSRSQTDNSGSSHSSYIPQEVGRVAIWLLLWAVVNIVKSLCKTEESSGTQEGGNIYHVISGRMKKVIWYIW